MADESLEELSPEDAQRIAAIHMKLLNDPTTRRQALELYAKATGQPVPELAIYTSEDKLRAEFTEGMGKKDKEIQELQLRQKRDVLMSSLIDENVVGSRKEFEEVEKFGLENSIHDYRKAAKFYRLQSEASTPSSAPLGEDFGPVTAPEMPDLKKYNGNHHLAATAEANRAIADLRAGKVRLPSVQQ